MVLSSKDFRPMAKLTLAIGVNELYRILNPVPSDIEDCFSQWAVQAVGTAALLDFDSLWKSFPYRCRNGDEMATNSFG